MLFDEKENHFSKSLYRYSHEKESEYADDEVSSCFSEFFDEVPSEHDDKRSYNSSTEKGDNTIECTIAVHGYNICHSRCRESERKGEGDNESFIKVFMDEVISLNFINLCTICFFSLHHRECDKKEDNCSCYAEILSFESEKGEQILPDDKGSKHRYKEYKTESFSIFSVFFRTGIWMEFCVEGESGEWFKEGNE